MKRRKWLGLLLAAVMVLTMVPTMALAAGTDTGKAIQLVDSRAAANIGGGQADNIYFGAYQQSSNGSGGYNVDPIKWRVLSNANGQLFLLSDQNLDVFQYNTTRDDTIKWRNSTIRSWLNGYGQAKNKSKIDYTDDNFMDNAFSAKEQVAIAETVVSTIETTDKDITDRVFLLSKAEANNLSYFPNGSSSRYSTNTDYVYAGGKLQSYIPTPEASESPYYYWWLRTRSNDSKAKWVDDGGFTGVGDPMDNSGITVRPAFNLNLNSVLFTSGAVGGKASGTIGTLSEVSDYTENEWKLTLRDTTRSGFSADVNGETSISTSAGGSVQIDYSGAQTGTNEYVSVLLCDSTGNVLYYGNIAQNSANGTATLNIPSELTVGNYTLKVFSEQCNGDYKTDYASAFQDISLNVLSKETAPQAVFTAAGDNGGTLSNVNTTMKYSTDGGASWNDITGTTMDITGVTSDKDIQVVKKGNGTTTSDSEAQIIDVTQAAQPAGIGTTDCTTPAQNDGTITGVDNTMEYRLPAASEWTSISGNTVSGLANGTYEVRVKANGMQLASPAVTITLGEHTCVAQQGDWQYDENNHWKLCACGATVVRAAHSGGTANCTEQALCETCGAKYGEPLGHNVVKIEAKTATCTEDGNITYWHCDACKAYFRDGALNEKISKDDTVLKATGHKFEDGVCTVCGAEDPNYQPVTEPQKPDQGSGEQPTQPTQQGDEEPMSDNSPKSGDDFSIAIPAAAAGLALAVMAAVVVTRRRHN